MSAEPSLGMCADAIIPRVTFFFSNVRSDGLSHLCQRRNRTKKSAGPIKAAIIITSSDWTVRKAPAASLRLRGSSDWLAFFLAPPGAMASQPLSFGNYASERLEELFKACPVPRFQACQMPILERPWEPPTGLDVPHADCAGFIKCVRLMPLIGFRGTENDTRKVRIAATT